MLFCRFLLTAFICSVTCVLGIAITEPPPDSTLSSSGEHQISWTYTALDPASMQIGLFDQSTGAFFLIAVVDVASGGLFLSITLPVGSNLSLQCTAVGNPADVLAQSGPYAVASGDNPFNISTISGSASVPAGQSISVFSGPAGTGLFPISTITNALVTTSVPTTAIVVSSAVQSTTSVLVLTATTTLYSNLASVTSVGSVEVPGTVALLPSPSPAFPLVAEEIPLVVHTVLLGPPIASFRKWKRVADQTTVSLGAVTITGTKGTPQTTSSSSTTSISSPATTISPQLTTQTITPPPVTVTAQQSTRVVTLPPTIITVTPSGNATRPAYVSPQPRPPPSPVTAIVPAPASTFTVIPAVNGSGTIQTIIATQCAICTSGLINAGTGLSVGVMFLWSWIALAVVVVVKWL